MPTRTKLADLDVVETSGVDHPAHLHEGWLVIKAAAGEDIMDLNQTDSDIDNTVESDSVETDSNIEKSTESSTLLKELGDLRKELADMRVEKQQMIAAAELAKAVETASGWMGLPGVDPQTLGAALVDIRKHAPAAAELIESIFAKAAVALGETAVLAEIGVDTQSDDNLADAWSMIEHRANDLVATGEARSFAKAVTLIAERDRDLYTRYLSEKGI